MYDEHCCLFSGCGCKKVFERFSAEDVLTAQFMTLAVISEGVCAKLILSIIWLVEKGLFNKMT